MKINRKYTVVLFVVTFFIISCKEVRRKYTEDGKLRVESEYKGGKLNGIAKMYSLTTGKLEILSHYKDDKLNGDFIEYAEDGSMERKALFEDGKQNGPDEWYDSIGHLTVVENYKDNQLHGKRVEYYEDGSLKFITHWENGLRQKVDTSYYSNGQIESETSWKDSIRDGYFKSYYLNGKLSMDALVENGVTVYYQEYDSLGNLLKDHWGIIITGPISIHLGETYKTLIRLPGPKEGYECYVSYYDKNINTLDRVNYGYGIDEVNPTPPNKKVNENLIFWKHNLKGKKSKEIVEAVKVPINEQKEGIFNYKPTIAGHYALLGVYTLVDENPKVKGVLEKRISYPFTIEFDVVD